MTMEEVRAKKGEILDIAARHGAFNVRLFGSVARGEAGPESDVDFLVEMEQGRSLWDRAGLMLDFQEFFGCKVDVATEKCLRPRIKERVMKEAIML